jgi:hypothetical protein
LSRLALFIGSGISLKLAKGDDGLLMGLPDWETLIKNLYSLKGEKPPVNTDFPKAAESFRLRFCKDDDDLWIATVSEALYRDATLDFETIRKNDTLGAIGALIMASLRGSVSEIVSFNYDDVLERYLTYHGLKVIPTFEERFWANRGDAIIYHPHGFLPSPGSPFATRSTFVVLDRKSYSARTGHSDERMNQKMETVMQSHTCLFIGLSGDDERLDNLMLRTQSEGKHARNPTETAYWGVAFSTSHDPTDALRWEERGVYLHTLGSYQPDLPRLLFEVCQKAATRC